MALRNPARPPVRHRIQREHIDEDALFIGHMLLMFSKKKSILPPKLAVAPAVTIRGHVILKIEPVGIQIILACLAETLVIVPEHGDVCVVVPGDETAVAHRSQKGPGDDVIADTVFPAYPVRFPEKLQLRHLEPSERFRIQFLHRRPPAILRPAACGPFPRRIL